MLVSRILDGKLHLNKSWSTRRSCVPCLDIFSTQQSIEFHCFDTQHGCTNHYDFSIEYRCQWTIISFMINHFRMFCRWEQERYSVDLKSTREREKSTRRRNIGISHLIVDIKWRCEEKEIKKWSTSMLFVQLQTFSCLTANIIWRPRTTHTLSSQKRFDI